MAGKGDPQITVVIPFYIGKNTEEPRRYQGTLGPWSGVPVLGDEHRRRLNHLWLTLTSLATQTLPSNEFEVIIVDDGSVVDVEPHLKKWDLDLRLRLVRQEHAGFCTGYNRGIDEALAPLVFLAVDHDILGPESLQAHVAQHAEVGTAAVSGRQRYLFHSILYNDITDPAAGMADLGQLALLPGLGWLPAAVRMLGLDRKPVTVDAVRHHFDKVEWLASCTREYADVEEVLRTGLVNKLRCGWLAMRNGSNSLPTDLLRRIGGLDSALDAHFGWYAEHDLGLRLSIARVPFAFAEAAVSIDLFHGPPARAAVGKSTGLAYMVSKHQTIDVAMLPHYLDHVLDIEQYSRQAEAAARWWTVGEES